MIWRKRIRQKTKERRTRGTKKEETKSGSSHSYMNEKEILEKKYKEDLEKMKIQMQNEAEIARRAMVEDFEKMKKQMEDEAEQARIAMAEDLEKMKREMEDEAEHTRKTIAKEYEIMKKNLENEINQLNEENSQLIKNINKLKKELANKDNTKKPNEKREETKEGKINQILFKNMIR